MSTINESSGLRKPSAMRLPSGIPSINSFANITLPVPSGVLQPSSLKQPTAIPTAKLSSNLVLKPGALNNDATTVRSTGIAAPSYIHSTNTFTRLPLRSSSLLAGPMAIPKHAAPANVNATRVIQTPSTVATVASITPATPTVATHTSLSSSPILVSLVSAEPCPDDDLVAILAAEAEFAQASEHQLPACFMEDTTEGVVEPAIPSTSAEEPAAVGSVTAPEVVGLDAAPSISSAAPTFGSRENASVDDSFAAAEEEDGFGQFSIPESPSKADRAFQSTNHTSTAAHRPLLSLPPIQPYIEPTFPYTLDTSDSSLVSRRIEQIEAAKISVLKLQAEIDLYASKIFSIVQLSTEAENGRFSRLEFVKDLVATIQTSPGVEFDQKDLE